MKALASSKGMSAGMGMQRRASRASFSAMPPHPQEPITRSPGFRSVTPSPTLSTSPATLAAGAEGAGRLELVAVLDDQRVGIVHAAGAHADHRLAGAGHGVGDLLDHQRVGPADLLRQHRAHSKLSLVSRAPRR